MRRSAVAAAVALIGLGTFLLLRNTGAIDESVSLWPPVLLGVGLWLLFMRLTAWRWASGGFVPPMVLIAIGGFLLLRDLDQIDQSVSIWPGILIAAGLGVLLEALPRRRVPGSSSLEIPLEGARTAHVRLDHGGGLLRVAGAAPVGTLVQGTMGGPFERDVRRSGDDVEVRLRRRFSGGAWGGAAEWRLALTGEIPVELELHTGAGETNLDLSDIDVSDLRIETGASQTEVRLPGKGRFSVRVKAGAAGVTIHIPESLAARIIKRTGLAGFEIDTARFPSTNDGYLSPDFETAEHRVKIDIEGGLAGFAIR